MAVPKKKTSKTRTNRRYRTWVSKEQKRLTDQLVLVPYGNGAHLKPAHVYLDDGADLRKVKTVKKTVAKAIATGSEETPTDEKKPAPKAKKPAAKRTKKSE